MTKREIVFASAAGFLLLTNVATVVLWRYQVFDMRQSSSFKVVADDDKADTYFKPCLDRNNIEHKIEDGHIKIREVDNSRAVASCM